MPWPGACRSFLRCSSQAVFLSGTFFVTADLPPIGPWLLELNPVSYAIGGVRTGLLGYAGGNLAAGAFYLFCGLPGLGRLAVDPCVAGILRTERRFWHI